jgi:hypothetical protein
MSSTGPADGFSTSSNSHGDSQGWVNVNLVPPGHAIYSTYPFLHFRRATTLAREDIAYLESKGCLSIPNKMVIYEFVRHYFLHMHTAMPVLDEAEFWDVYLHWNPQDEGRRVSLLVFQCILFASCPVRRQRQLRSDSLPPAYAM